ncbi:hypothetical protein RIEPE_0498 [Candidatus Riesia pediculicola USDA]|uniref:Uncharacterized protein n=1 Tax=Riesia pediculicola (strain USDA) TaxID=515618 RepID=D4G8S6_RIEPU|nr:hypothetical protein RIEPE_0498 [Candidatus Riesia pediculicola USDA]
MIKKLPNEIEMFLVYFFNILCQLVSFIKIFFELKYLKLKNIL